MEAVEAPLALFLWGVWGRGRSGWGSCSSWCCCCRDGSGVCVGGGGVLPDVVWIGVVVRVIGPPDEVLPLLDERRNGMEILEPLGFEEGWGISLEEPFALEELIPLELWFLDKGHIVA